MSIIVLPGRNQYSALATPWGDAFKDAIVHDLLAVMGDVRLLMLYGISDTTTTTDLSLNARTITHDSDLSSELFAINSGTGLFRQHNGTTGESDMPDTANLSFGNSTVDEPFTILALVNPDTAAPAADMEIAAKWDRDTDGEYREYRCLVTGTNGYPRVELYDESANAYIGREDQTAVTAATWVLLGFHYNGTSANAGIDITKNAALVDDANSSSGTYVAMEDTATKLAIAHSLSAAVTPVATNFWDGGIAFIGVCQGNLSVAETWAVKSILKSYFNLPLL